MGKVGQVAIHLIEGKAKGLRLVEYGNWAGRGIGGPATVWPALLARPEMAQAGLFFLKRSPSAFQKGVVQVGMAMELRPALQAIADDPIHADIAEILVFVRRWGWEKPDELTYLGTLLREQAKTHPGLELLTTVGKHGKLELALRADLETDLDHMLELLALSGFEWEDTEAEVTVSFEMEEKQAETPAPPISPSDTAAAKPVYHPATRAARKPGPKSAAKGLKELDQTSLFQPAKEKTPEEAAPVAPVAEVVPSEELVVGKYHLADKKGIKATMDIVDGKFIVRKGSHANKREFKGMADNYKKIRLKLVEEGILIDKGGDFYVFSQDHAFQSASTSASVIKGAQTAGPRHWYDKNNVSLRGIENDNHRLNETRHTSDTFPVELEEESELPQKKVSSHEAEEISSASTSISEKPASKSMSHTAASHQEEYLVSEHTGASLGAYRIIGKRVNATMDILWEGYRVKRGSQALKQVSDSISKRYLELRDQLIAEGILVDAEGEYFVFAKDHLFRAISAASSIVLGRQTDGWISWRDKNGDFPPFEK